MGVSAKSIWLVPAYLPYVQPPLTSQVLDAAERKIGYTLPLELVELLRQQNGGYIRHHLPGVVHNRISGIGAYYPSLTEFDWDEVQEHVDFPLKGLVPFDGDGHWHLCLDYRTNPNQPTISWIDIESNEQEAVAASFSGYLAKLRIDSKNKFAVLGIPTEENLAKRITELFKVQFDPPSSWAHGYPIRCAGFDRGSERECIWIWSNRVPRGFVRENHDRYQEIKDLMRGFGRQFPELGDEAMLLQATDGIQQDLVAAMTKSGIAIRSLREVIGVG